MIGRALAVLLVACVSCLCAADADCPPLSPTAGGPLPGLSSAELQFFYAARARFQAVDSVSNTVADAPPGGINGGGLGPRYNANSCAACHAQPTVGGSSPTVNPQVALATLDGASNTVPSFITSNGPVREARFISDGKVHQLYVITGRSDAVGCTISQPDFATAITNNNIIYRIPTPLFGLGLVEATPDQNLIDDANALTSARTALGITGTFNRSGNDGSITRFGWKAQNKSLLMFAGEAYNVEVGTTNELFPNELDDTAGCRLNPLPEDFVNLTNPQVTGFPPSDFSSDLSNFAEFIRLAAPPTPATPTTDTEHGQAVFESTGCNMCHVEHHTTGSSLMTGQSSLEYFPYSDFQLHHMGTTLADGITQGLAASDQFRTAPLWGLGERLFYLHDGRTSSLTTAITDHSGSGSEANTVITNFNALSSGDKTSLLNFLGSL